MKYSSSYFLLSITIVFLFVNCQNKTVLSKKFSCKNHSQLQELESVIDFNKNFKVNLPKYWNTKLYYDNVQSEIFSADTIKSLTESYIMEFAWVNDTIQISDKLQEKLLQISEENAMKTSKESFHKFKGMEAYAHLGLGKSNDYTFRVFQYYIKFNEDNYIRVKTEFYGDNNFESRFCEALSIIETIEFLSKD